MSKVSGLKADNIHVRTNDSSCLILAIEVNMGFWVIPFLGVALLILGGLSLVVVEYQDQKSRRFEDFKQIH